GVGTHQAAEIATLWVRTCHKEAHIRCGSLRECRVFADRHGSDYQRPGDESCNDVSHNAYPHLLSRVQCSMVRSRACFCDDGKITATGSRWLLLYRSASVDLVQTLGQLD